MLMPITDAEKRQEGEEPQEEEQTLQGVARAYVRLMELCSWRGARDSKESINTKQQLFRTAAVWHSIHIDQLKAVGSFN